MTMTIGRLFATEPLSAIEVQHAFDIEVHFQPVQTFTSPTGGTRVTFIVDYGTARGPLFNGEFLPGGGDWVMLGADGIGRLDVRATLRADDGHLVHMTNTGRANLDADTLQRFTAGEEIGWNQAYIRSSPLFETDSERYAWFNSTTFTAVNEVALDHVHYRIYRIM